MIRLIKTEYWITHVQASFNRGRRWIHIGDFIGPQPFMGSPLFSDMDPEDRQFLLNMLWQKIPQRPVYLCPKPTKPGSWTDNDSTTSSVVDMLSSKFRTSGEFASAH